MDTRARSSPGATNRQAAFNGESSAGWELTGSPCFGPASFGTIDSPAVRVSGDRLLFCLGRFSGFVMAAPPIGAVFLIDAVAVLVLHAHRVLLIPLAIKKNRE